MTIYIIVLCNYIYDYNYIYIICLKRSGVDSFAAALVQRFFSAASERLLPAASAGFNVELADRTKLLKRIC